MKNDNVNLTIEQEIVRDCPILFRMINRPCTETTMCWGFECAKGWHSEIGKTCRLFEVLNTEFYPKYRVRIQADQIKEKYGTLRFYYSVIQDPGKIKTFIANTFRFIENYFSNINYKLKTVVDVEPYDYIDVSEITKEEYDKDTSLKGLRASNVKYFEENGKYLKKIYLHNYGRSHREPTRFKIFWKLMNFSKKMYNKLMYCNICSNAKARNCISVLDDIAYNEIRKLEARCENICEICGVTIGTKYSPKCETQGYIRYVCSKCLKEIEK